MVKHWNRFAEKLQNHHPSRFSKLSCTRKVHFERRLDQRLPEGSFSLSCSKLSMVYSEVLGTNPAQFPLHNFLLPQKAEGNFTPVESEKIPRFVQGCTEVKSQKPSKPIQKTNSDEYSPHARLHHEHPPDTPIVRNFRSS